MKINKKKLLAFLLCLCMFVSLVPGVGAEEIEDQAAQVEENTEEEVKVEAPSEELEEELPAEELEEELPAEEPAAELPEEQLPGEEQLPEEELNVEDTCELEEEVLDASGGNACRIGSTEYSTWGAALSAANSNGGTIVLLRDIDMQDVTPKMISHDMTIDFNGWTLTGNIRIYNASVVLMSTPNSESGKIGGITYLYTKSHSSDHAHSKSPDKIASETDACNAGKSTYDAPDCIFLFGDSANVTIKSGYYYTANHNEANVIDTQKQTLADSKPYTFTINGGKYHSPNGNVLFCIRNINSGSHMTINAGTFQDTSSDGRVLTIRNNGSNVSDAAQRSSFVTINGGEFTHTTFFASDSQTIYDYVPQSNVKTVTNANNETWYIVEKMGFMANLTLGESLDLNIYATEEASKAHSAYNITYTVHGLVDSTNTVNLDSLPTVTKDEVDYKVLSIPFAVKNGVDDVDVALYDTTCIAPNYPLFTTTKSVKSCCEYYANPDNNCGAKLQKLARSLLEYITSMQEYKEYKTGSPANADYTLEGNDLITVVPETYADSAYNGKSGTLDGIKVQGRSLSHETKTRMFIYFKITDSAKSMEDYTFSLSSNLSDPIAYQTIGNNKYIPLPGFDASQMDSVRTLYVSDGTNTMTVWYSPLNYAYKMQDNAEVGSVAKFMYNYFYYANQYFNP